MYKVYWTVTEDGQPYPMSMSFDTTEMLGAMNCAEDLRKARRAGAPVSFISVVSEHPDAVGEAGVASIKDGKTPDGHVYDWVKRRSTELRRDASTDMLDHCQAAMDDLLAS